MLGKRRNDNDVKKKIAAGAALAAAAGYLAGVLTAPKSGKATRHDIKVAADHSGDIVEKEVKQLYKQVDDLVAKAKDMTNDLSGSAKKELDDLLAKTHSSRKKVQDMAENIKPGKGVENDLKKAVDDANKAIEHLKKYLKK